MGLVMDGKFGYNDVIEIFKEVLLKDEVKENSNFFFDLEGTSLDYFSLISQLNQRFNVEITFKEENNFVKYLPTSNEIECFEGSDFMDIDTFYEIYLDELKIEFDSDVVYPYYWPINA